MNELLGEHVCVDVGIGASKQLDRSLDAIDKDDDVLGSLSLQLDGVPSGEFQIGTEIPAGIGIDNVARQWR